MFRIRKDRFMPFSSSVSVRSLMAKVHFKHSTSLYKCGLRSMDGWHKRANTYAAFNSGITDN